MKFLKPIISLLLVAVLSVSTVLSVSAENADDCSVLGDIDADGVVSILDGTCLQLHLADLKTLSDNAVIRGDADLDGDTTVVDVTHLQRYIAQDESCVFYLGMEIDTAKYTKEQDDEAVRLANEALAADEAAAALKAEASAAKAERTRQAVLDYRAKYKEYEKTNGLIAQIQNYQRTKGVDISEFNGNVDFNKLKAAGYTFVMIRMGFGGNKYDQDDSLFEENVKKAEAAGMPWGAYLYSYALDTTAVKSEINHTLRLLKDKKPTMPIAFDIENDTYKARNGMPSDKMLHDICLTYLKGIESAGYYPILYTGYYWLTGALNAKDLTGTYDIWYAQWSSKMDYVNDKIGMWQYGGEVNFLESPYISGLSGMFDKDFCYKNYPVIITAYGYNNHTAILNSGLASTAAPQDGDLYIEDGVDLPDEYNGVMGDSFRQ